jgi:hypothetical protein
MSSAKAGNRLPRRNTNMSDEQRRDLKSGSAAHEEGDEVEAHLKSGRGANEDGSEDTDSDDDVEAHLKPGKA